MIHEAIILAGGMGTRLRSAVPDLPKCMVPVAGKPFLSYLIEYWSRQGIERFIFSLGYKHDIVEAFLQSYFQEKKIGYASVVEDEPLGTGGAILKSAWQCQTEHVAVVNGDSFFAVDLKQISLFHTTHNAECTLALKAMTNSDRYGVVETDSHHRVISFKEKKWYATSLINGGAYTVHIPSFASRNLPEKFSFEKDYLENYYRSGKIAAIVQEGYFIDIGIPEDYERAQTELLEHV